MSPGRFEAESERLLIERTREGSSEALEDLVLKHSAKIYRWSFRILKNHEDAQDNCQNVLYKVCRSINTFKGRSRFSTWLFRMTMNEALMKLRRSRSQPVKFAVSETENENKSVLDIRDRKADPEQQYLAKELVSKALLTLHPSVIQLLVRHKTEGWTQRELADKMGISVAALKARIFSARERMIARLHELC